MNPHSVARLSQKHSKNAEESADKTANLWYSLPDTKTRYPATTGDHMRTPVITLSGLQRVVASLTLALSVALTASAQTQITTGTISGTVKDIKEAVIAGAAVEIKNNATNVERSTTTNNDGRFTALQLQPGQYTVTVSSQGF